MRLIDADRNWEVTECEDNGYKLEYYEGILALYDNNGACICEFMPDLPTAYDIDKVVEDLNCDRCESCSLLEVCAGSKCCTECHKKIIEIVKKGGVDNTDTSWNGGVFDDVCEWKHGERFRGMETLKTGCCGKTMILTALEAADINDCPEYAMKYCPYCGKRIKVVE